MDRAHASTRGTYAGRVSESSGSSRFAVTVLTCAREASTVPFTPSTLKISLLTSSSLNLSTVPGILNFTTGQRWPGPFEVGFFGIVLDASSTADGSPY